MLPWAVICGLVLMAVMSLWFLGRGVYLAALAGRFHWSATKTVGEVIQIHTQSVWQEDDRGAERVEMHYPVIAFTDGKGRRRTVQADHGCRHPAYRPGERVSILYDPGDPKEMRIASFAALYQPAAVSLGKAAVTTAIFCGWLTLSLK
jgi:hypothetical protein